jgi:hypothetical protein
MHYRAGMIGASISIEADPQGGTIVNCGFPFRAMFPNNRIAETGQFAATVFPQRADLNHRIFHHQD